MESNTDHLLTASSPSTPPLELLKKWIEQFGPLVLDVAKECFVDPSAIQAAFRSTFRSIYSDLKRKKIQNNVQLWILVTLYEEIKKQWRPDSSRPYVSDDRLLDRKLKFFLSRLSLPEKFALICQIRHHVPGNAIAAALRMPPQSVHLMVARTLQVLADQLWPDEAIKTDTALQEKRRAEVASLVISSPIEPVPRSAIERPLDAHSLTQVDPAVFSNRSFAQRWRRLPWHWRTLIEGSFFTLLILVAVVGIPRAREAYEKGLNSTYNPLDTQTGDTAIEEFADYLEAASEDPADLTETVTETTPENPETVNEEILKDSKKGTPRVEANEIWRFTLKTGSPEEFKLQVFKIIEGFDQPTSSNDVQTSSVPGGIQLTFLLPDRLALSLKEQLESITSKKNSDGQPAEADAELSWYKNKAKREVIPAGKIRVVIWLVQI